MRLTKNKQGNIEAVDAKAVFKHCTGGRDEVAEHEYFEVVELLMVLHGYVMFEYDWIAETTYVNTIQE